MQSDNLSLRRLYIFFFREHFLPFILKYYRTESYLQQILSPRKEEDMGSSPIALAFSA